MKKHTVFVKVSEDIFQELKKMSKEEEIPISIIVRKLLKEALKKRRKKNHNGIFENTNNSENNQT
ncbi:MAG: hypothetical protein NZM44_04415 [Candidatus Calescibacterium sp.]|nr:hypothetical protein [Candidatus Calescibacterium sp.]